MRARKDGEFRRLLASRLTTAAALYVRLSEKAEKLALLHAISENPGNPVISLDAVLWATKLLTHLTKRMLYLSQFYMAEGKFDHLKRRTIGILAEAPDRQLSRSELLRSLHVDVNTFNRIIATLHACDLIEEELIGRRKSLITLKDAA